MKIKVLNLKSLSKYFSKTVILFITIAILSRFLYKQKISNICIKVNSSNFINILGKEIGLFDKSKNKKSSSSSQKMLDQEFELAKLATAQTVSNINQVDGNISEIAEQNNEESTIITSDIGITKSEINEPGIRPNN